MKPILALSTSWNSQRHQDGYAMLQEIAALGFQHVELSHGIRIPLVPGILRAVSERVVRVSSTHNFCPLPTGVNRAAPNLYQPSAASAAERDQWVRHTRRSLDFAAQVKAEVLVCHLGSVEFFWLNPGRRLQRHLHHPPAGAPAEASKRRHERERAMARLRQRQSRYWEHARAGVAAVLEHARAAGVRLGIENRERFEELPLDADIAPWLETFAADAPIGYWHDTGHAEIKATLGLVDHQAHLQANATRTLGFHLHDVSATGRDHEALGEGRIDFGMVSRFWRPAHRLTLEFSPRISREQVLASKQRLETWLEGK